LAKRVAPRIRQIEKARLQHKKAKWCYLSALEWVALMDQWTNQTESQL
jgi:hypothetical protein